MKILSLDYGEAKIGLALGEVESGVAVPYGIMRNLGWNNVASEIKKLCEKEGINKVIVGLPVNPNTLDSQAIRKIKDFISQLKKQTSLEIEAWDERFSTQAAQKLITKNKAYDDDVAAMLILQSYFDSKSAG